MQEVTEYSCDMRNSCGSRAYVEFWSHVRKRSAGVCMCACVLWSKLCTVYLKLSWERWRENLNFAGRAYIIFLK